MTRWRGTIGWSMVAVILVVVPRVIAPERLAMLGPLAGGWLWLPAAIAALACVARPLDPRIGWTLSLAARLSVWVLPAMVVVDPARNLPDLLWTATDVGLARVGAAIRWAVGGLLVLGVAAMVIGSMVGGPSGSSPARRTVTTGSSVHPLVAMLLRLVLRLALGTAFLAVRLILLAVAWTLDGRTGIAVLLGRETGPVSRASAALITAAGASGRANSWSGALVGRASAGWGRGRVEHGVWIEPVAIVRDEDGTRHDEPWVPDARMTLVDRELRELCTALLAAMDVVLQGAPRGGSGKADSDPGGDPRRQGSAGPRLTPYRLAIARAWSTPDYHAVVIQATQPAGTAVARATMDVLLPALDSASGWAAEDLRSMIHLSDRRVAADPLRGGAVGLTVAMDRQPAEEQAPVNEEPTRAAIDRALHEAGLARRFRFESTEDGYDAVVHEYRASFRNAAEFAAAEAEWKGLQAAIALYARTRDVRLESVIDPTYAFTASFPKPAAEFPSGAAIDWRTVVTRHPAPSGRPMRLCIGVLATSEPVWIEVSGESAHLLLSGASGGGKTTTLLGIICSVLHNHLVTPRSGPMPELVIVDAVKQELSSRLGPAATEIVSASDPDAVLDLLQRFTQAMDERYAQLGGRPFDPKTMPRRLLVVEEAGDVQDLMDTNQRTEFTRMITRLVSVGRACGISVVLSLQRASSGGAGGAVLGPRIRSGLARVTHFQNQAADYALALDRPVRRLLPRIPGRAALIDGQGEIIVFQALRISDTDIAEVVGRVAQHRGAGTPPPVTTEEPEPQRPTAAEAARLDTITTLRLVFLAQQEADHPASVSVRGLMDQVRSMGYTAGRTERYTAALAQLEELGILEPSWPGIATSPRRLVAGLTWERAAAIVERPPERPSSANQGGNSGMLPR